MRHEAVPCGHDRRRAAATPSLSSRAEEVSDLDKRIIEHLQADGRRPFTQIAAELGVSEAAVRARTNRLIERGILQVVGVTDPLKLGFQQMAMIGIRCESDRLVVGRGAGRRDARGRLRRHHRRHLRPAHRDRLRGQRGAAALPDRELRSIDGVRETETFVYLRMVKQTYQWGTR